MSTSRVYRRACEKEHILREILEGRGKQFDPRFTDVFLELWKEGALEPVAAGNAREEEEQEFVTALFLCLSAVPFSSPYKLGSAESIL